MKSTDDNPMSGSDLVKFLTPDAVAQEIDRLHAEIERLRAQVKAMGPRGREIW